MECTYTHIKSCPKQQQQQQQQRRRRRRRRRRRHRLKQVSDRWFARVFHKWTSLADGQWLYAEPHGGEDSDGYVRCYGTNVRPFAWSWLQPFTTAGVGGSRRTKAYGHRRQPARVLPSASNFPLTMAGPRVGSGRRPCWSRGRRRGTGGTRGSGMRSPRISRSLELLPNIVQFFAAQLPLSKCRRSSWTGLRSAWGIICASRRWWNSWCMCRLSYLFLRSSSLLPSRSLTFQFRVEMEEGHVEVFKVLSQDNSAALHVKQTVDIPVPGRAGGGGARRSSRFSWTGFNSFFISRWCC